MRVRQIVFDLDDVLANFRDSFHDISSNVCGNITHWTDPKFKFDELHHFVGLNNNEEMFDFLIKHRILENCKVEEGAIELLQKTKALGYYNRILTARGWHPNGAAVTYDWLNQHKLFDYIDELGIVQLHEDKSAVLKKEDNIILYVEDNVKHLQAAIDKQLTQYGVIISRPWNSHFIENGQRKLRAKNMRGVSSIVNVIQQHEKNL